MTLYMAANLSVKMSIGFIQTLFLCFVEFFF